MKEEALRNGHTMLLARAEKDAQAATLEILVFARSERHFSGVTARPTTTDR
jgi:hypothetical protein